MCLFSKWDQSSKVGEEREGNRVEPSGGNLGCTDLGPGAQVCSNAAAARHVDIDNNITTVGDSQHVASRALRRQSESGQAVRHLARCLRLSLLYTPMFFWSIVIVGDVQPVGGCEHNGRVAVQEARMAYYTHRHQVAQCCLRRVVNRSADGKELHFGVQVHEKS